MSDSRDTLDAVQPGYRLGVILRWAGVGLVVCGIFTFIMFMALHVEFTGGFEGVWAAADQAAASLAACIIPSAVLCSALVGFACAFIGIRASHKIAGPAYRLATDLRRMAGGDRDFAVATRPDDQLADLADALEHARSELQAELAPLDDSARHIAEAAFSNKADADEVSRLLDELELALDQATDGEDAAQ